MCAFSENPVTLTVKVVDCEADHMKVEIVSGLGEESAYWKGEQILKTEKSRLDNCKNAEIVRKISVSRNCCDTPNTECFFGWFLREVD